jgi:uncharacterized protein with PIN domain
MPGKNKDHLMIVDADAIISFVYVNDENHRRAKHLMQQLVTSDAYLLFPATAICEAVTVLRGKLNRPEDAKRLVSKFQSGDFPVQAPVQTRDRVFAPDVDRSDLMALTLPTRH